MSLIIALALAAEAGSARPSQECEILAAVAREHLSLGARLAPPLQPAGPYLPACDWKALGLMGFAASKDWPRGRLIFHRPTINGSTAGVYFLIIYGVRSGQGDQCRLSRVRSKWHVESCARRIAL
jgi:hypothetical protein